MVTESELRQQLDDVKQQRRLTRRYTEQWASLCVEMGRITAQIWRLRADMRRTNQQWH